MNDRDLSTEQRSMVEGWERQHRKPHGRSAGRPAVHPVQRQPARRLWLVAVVCALDLLLVAVGFAPASQMAALAAPLHASPTGTCFVPGSLAAAAANPPPHQAPTRSPLDCAVTFEAAPGERLDVVAALDQGARMFILRARYHDWGPGQNDYYLASPTEVSHQPLSEIFAPLATWLAAPGHAGEAVVLALATDPRSAQPGRFDAACQAFKDYLGPYLVKFSGPPWGQARDALAQVETSATPGGPRLYSNWSGCTGRGLPGPRPSRRPAPAPSDADLDRWMAELGDTIGQRALKQVIIPGSHDAGTFGWFGDLVTQLFAQAQSAGITSQLDAGSRYFDLRATFKDQAGQAGPDYWNNHGSAVSTNVRLRDMLRDIAAWANQPGHEREIVVLDISVSPAGDPDPTRLPNLCKDFLAQAGNRLLQPLMVPGCSASGTSSGPGDPIPVSCILGGVWNLSMNEIWALPNSPTIITNWDWCTGQTWPKEPGFDEARSPVDTFYANQCQAGPYPGEPDTGIIAALATALPDRSSAKDNPLCSSDPLPPPLSGLPCRFPEVPDNAVGGLWVLFTQGTQSSACILDGPANFGDDEIAAHAAVQDWYTKNQHSAQRNLNIIAGDFVQERGIVDTAIAMNELALGPKLEGPEILPPFGTSAVVSCLTTNPQSATLRMIAYPVPEGPNSPHARMWEGAGDERLKAQFERTQFPPGSYDIRVVCAGEPGGLVSGLTFPTSSFSPVMAVFLGQSDDRGREVTCRALGEVKSFALTIFPTAEGPDSPHRRGPFPSDPNHPGTDIRDSMFRDDFPPGDYELTATCDSSDTPPWTAATTFRTTDLPALPPSGISIGCAAQRNGVFSCALQLTLPTSLAVNTVLTSLIAGPGVAFSNPGGGGAAAVTSSPGCVNPPIPSPYLLVGHSYARFDVNVSTGGCATGAVITFTEQVVGTPGERIEQVVKIPDHGDLVGAGWLPTSSVTRRSPRPQ